jgi:hypothetical protein
MCSLAASLKSNEESKELIIYLSRTFGMIKPDAYNYIGKIISAIERDGFLIGNIKMTKMSLMDS